MPPIIYRKFVFCFCLIGLAGSITAQDSLLYHINWKNARVPIILTGASSIAGGILRHNMRTFEYEDIIQLDASTINGLDRFATENFSVNASTLSDYTAYISIGAALAAVLDQKNKSGLKTGLILYAEVFFLNSGLTLFGKAATQRTRPLVYNADLSNELKINKSARSSFPSGHTSLSSSSSFFAAKLFADSYPDSKFKPLVWGIAATLPAVTGYLRIEAGKHFVTDVVAGYILGAGIGILVPQWHKKLHESNSPISFNFGINGARLVYNFG